MISRGTIESIHDQVEIYDIIKEHVDLKKAGAQYKGCCPFHSENTPSFVVSPSLNRYKCFGCGASGDSIQFLKDHLGISYPEALKVIAEKYGITIQEETKLTVEEKNELEELQKVLQFAFKKFLNELEEMPYNDPPAQYLMHWRELDPLSIQEFELGYAPNDFKFLTTDLYQKGLLEPAKKLELVKEKNGTNYDAFIERIIFPIRNHRAQLIGFGGRVLDEEKGKKYGKYINSSDSIVFNKSEVLYGLDKAGRHIRKKGEAILVEGYTDVILMHEVGHDITVGSCGTALTVLQARLLSRYTNRVVIFYDDDNKPDPKQNAGLQATLKAIDILLAEGFEVHVVRPPIGMDPDAFCREHKHNPEYITTYLSTKRQDGVLFKADYLLDNAEGPAEKARGTDELIKLIALIPNTIFREEYITTLSRKYSLGKAVVSKKVKKLATDEEPEIRHDAFSEYDLPSDLSEEEIETFKKHGFYEYRNRTVFATRDGQRELANFTLRSLFIIQSMEGSKRILEVCNFAGHRRILDVPIATLTSVAKFMEHTESLGNFIFEGTQSILNRWKHKLFEEEENVNEILTLGWQPEGGFYAFSNGILNEKNEFEEVDDYGVVNHKTGKYFISANSSIYSHDASAMKDEKRFRYKDRNIEFAEWAGRMRAVYDKNAVPAVTWYIASVFRDIVFGHSDKFPHLLLFGPPQSGKSELAFSLSYMFGDAQDQMNLNSVTQSAFFRKLSQFRNSVVWGDEYSNSLDPWLIEALKNAYDGTGRTLADYNGGKRTKKTYNVPPESALMISGQHLPISDPALFTRCILLQFKERKYDRKAFDELKRLQKDELSCVTVELLKHRKYFEREWREALNAAISHLESLVPRDIKVSARTYLNYGICLATYNVMSEVIDFPWTKNEVDDVLLAHMEEQTRLMSTSDELAQFWATVDYMFDRGIIHLGKDFDLKYEGDTATLYIRLTSIHNLYQEFFKKQGKVGALDKNSLIHYFKASDAYLGTVQSHRFSQYLNTSAFIFDYKKLNMSLHAKVDTGEDPAENKQELKASKEDDVPF